MKATYTKWHNNYDELKIGQTYEATRYKEGWLLIETGLYQKALYREECFTVAS